MKFVKGIKSHIKVLRWRQHGHGRMPNMKDQKTKIDLRLLTFVLICPVEFQTKY